MKCFLDTETCGLHGMAVIIQYAYDDGPIQIHNFWSRPIDESLTLIEEICKCEVIGFNLAFDWFHICKIYTIFSLLKASIGGEEYPDEHIPLVASLEETGRDGPCVKPFKSFDLMLHARKTEFQSTMERSDIRIRRVPTALAWTLAAELEKRIVLDSILFARKKNKLAPRWVVHDIKQADGQMNRHFKDLVLKFKPSVALKALAHHVLQIPSEEILAYGDIEVDRAYWPAECGYAPFASALTRLPKKERAKFKKKKPWPVVIHEHISHWNHHPLARKYASKDVEYTRRLYEYFGSPDTGDDDSELATMVGAVRWRGYAIDLEGIKELRKAAIERIRTVPTAPRQAKKYISAVLSETEVGTFTSTGKVVLEKMASHHNAATCKWCRAKDTPEQLAATPIVDTTREACGFCQDGSCGSCDKGYFYVPVQESAHRAWEVVDARKMKKEVELYDKLLTAGRFHASFKVIGALSGRMAGADKLNPQGIKRTKEVRSKFPLAFGGLKLWGGDFAGFEVVLADAVYNDPLLRKDLLTCEKCRKAQVIYTGSKKKCPECGSNKTMKIHALFGVHVYPDMDYDQIKATDGTADDRYNKSKSAVFAMIYGGMAFTLMTRLGVPIEVAEAAYQKFIDRYVGVGQARNRVIKLFCSIRQEGGIGSKIAWNEPAEYVESLLGFKRYFTLENAIVREVFALAENPPEEWKTQKIKVRRRDREQTMTGACQSALFGCAFQIQAGNMRAAANHEIQSSGAGITKHLQRNIWNVQPAGIGPWLVQPMNIHDQVLCPTDDSVVDRVNQIVYDTVESFRPRVPLIELEYGPMKDWGQK